MAGGYYTALSGMRTRMDALDRLAADIANASTAGYKTERAGTRQADRPNFGATLQSAVDVANGEARTDLRPGAMASTGRGMDVAIQGSGFFVVQTPQGERYTRNGHLVRGLDGTLSTDEGDAVLGTDGPIKIDTGTIEVDADGTVRNAGSIAGRLKIVDLGDNPRLFRAGGSRFSIEGTPAVVEKPTIVTGSLEQSNVSMAERVAELSDVARNFETLLRAVSVLMNDVDRGAITELGRK
jgi:flagellar basal-body rod protein FlgF